MKIKPSSSDCDLTPIPGGAVTLPRIMYAHATAKPLTPEERVSKLVLPEALKPLGTYVPARVSGNMLYLSGHGPMGLDGQYVCGKLGDTIDIEAGAAAARMTGLAMLATIKQTVGSLNRVKQLVKSLGMVHCTPEFVEHVPVRHPSVYSYVTNLHGRSSMATQTSCVKCLVQKKALGLALRLG